MATTTTTTPDAQIDLRGDDFADDVSAAAWAAFRDGTVSHLCDEHGPVATIIPAGRRRIALHQPVLVRTCLAGTDGEPLAGAGFYLGVHDVSRPAEDPDVDVLIGWPSPNGLPQGGQPDAGRVYTVRRSQVVPLYERARGDAVANILDGRELWKAGQVSVTGYRPCQARCADCPAWRPDVHYGPGRKAFTAALSDAVRHACTLHLPAAAAPAPRAGAVPAGQSPSTPNLREKTMPQTQIRVQRRPARRRDGDGEPQDDLREVLAAARRAAGRTQPQPPRRDSE